MPMLIISIGLLLFDITERFLPKKKKKPMMEERFKFYF